MNVLIIALVSCAIVSNNMSVLGTPPLHVFSSSQGAVLGSVFLRVIRHVGGGPISPSIRSCRCTLPLALRR